ncbi:MAG: hypothetical protein JXB50_12310 [Spirochaetes bacterium]|nr:hypothetical protein [Spirochaetota bacterium]
MALNKNTLENGLKTLFNRMKTHPNDDDLAEGMANLIYDFVKNAAVTGEANITSQEELTAPSSIPVTGTLS